MARELPSIGPALDFEPGIDPAIITLISTTITEGVGTLLGSKIVAGVSLGGVVTFPQSFNLVPIVTAVPEVL